MDKYFEGLPLEKVIIGGIECYKSDDGSFYRIDEGKTFVAIECAGDEHAARINDFEDVDLFDKEADDVDMIDVIRSFLKDLL